MKKSAILRRVYITILATLLFTASVTWLAFSAMAGSAFIRLRAADLLPRAQSFAYIADDFIHGRTDRDTVLSFTDVEAGDTSLVSAYAVITDRDGNLLLVSDRNGLPNEKLIHEQIRRVLAGETVVELQDLRGDRSLVTIGVPVRGRDGSLSGTLILYMNQIDTKVAKSVLESALLISMCIVVPTIFLLIYTLHSKLVKPIRFMRNVSRHMTEGRFDLRADESAPGEIGELGRSLNTMSQALRNSISELTYERNRLMRILNGLSEGIAAVDSLGKITHINPALEALFIPSVSDDPRLRVINVDEVWKAVDKAVTEGENSDFIVKQGEKDIRCLIAPVYDDMGITAGAVGMFRDISKEIRLENTRRDYVANVSHEMRTPLTAMRGLIEPLRDGMVKDEETRRRYYDIILRETLRLSRLINDIMELSRLQSGSVSIECEKIDAGEIALGLCEKYRGIAAEKGLTLNVESDFTALPPVWSNPDRVEELLVVLLDNAIKYTDEGSVSLRAAVRNDSVVFSVCDTGRGISEENIEHIFDRYFKVDKSHSGMGSGLGLAIAKEIANAMGERLWVLSEEGRGSEFCFTMRCADGNNGEATKV